MMFDQLKTFAATAKHHSVTKAARELGVSQPGVSRQLKLLEAHIGASCFAGFPMASSSRRTGNCF